MTKQIARLIPLLLVAWGIPLAGQAPPPRISVAVHGGYQPTTSRFEDSFTFARYQETGSTRVEYPMGGAFLFDGGAGVRLWRRLGAGLVVSRVGRASTASTRSFIPHPLYLDTPRQVDGEADAVQWAETGIHFHVRYEPASRGPLRIVISGGPSVLRLRQTLVTEARVREEYPYDTAEFGGVNTREVEGRANGFNVGADLGWMFTRHLGLGGTLRLTRAVIALDADQRRIPVEAGGAHIGVGLRLTF